MSIKEEIEKAFNEGKFYHGIAISKINFSNDFIITGEKGAITAYLPEDNKFAIWFSKEKWVNFDWSEEEFKNAFEIIQE